MAKKRKKKLSGPKTKKGQPGPYNPARPKPGNRHKNGNEAIKK